MNDTHDTPTLADLTAAAREVADATERLRSLIIDARNRRGLTLRTIAEATGRSVETIRTWTRDDDQ
jgi:transposase